MKNKDIQKIMTLTAMAALAGATLILSGCNNGVVADVVNTITSETAALAEGRDSDTEEESSTVNGSTGETKDGKTSSDMFSTRDLSGEYDASESSVITLNNNTAAISGSGAGVDGNTVTVSEEGTYILKGSFKGSVVVDAPEDAKVQLVLDGVTIENDGSAAIYVVEADKVFVTLADGSDNTIVNTGDFEATEENIDGAVYSKSDLTFNGTGKLTVSSEKGHGIVSKDDLKIAEGTYVITAGNHGISGKDSIRIADGTIRITATEDGLHSGNEEDPEKGYIYIASGSITINAGDDGIHATTLAQIDGGSIEITAAEGIEGTAVLLNDGDISISASDDGINAAYKSESYGTPYVKINGGNLTINMGQGDTDGIDSNGDLYINGGTVSVNGQFPFDYDKTAEHNGGTIIVNGEETDEITNQFGGGFGGGPGGNFGGGLEGRPEGGFDGNFEGRPEGGFDGNFEGKPEGGFDGNFQGRPGKEFNGNFEGRPEKPEKQDKTI